MKNPRKRLTSTYFLERYRRFLIDRGIVHLKTDSNFLFTYTSLMLEHNHLVPEALTDDLYHSPLTTTHPSLCAIQTYYEQMWLSRGLNIRYLQFRLPHEGLLEEPDVEIPLDDYRSYHRSKRSSLETAK
jgi:tRNA (guanine-N7-)-methyltransferase